MMATPIREATERILRIPLTLKLAVANTAVLAVGVAVTARAVGGPWIGSEAVGPLEPPGILLGIAVGTILLGAMVNAIVVRIALSPLRTLEETAIQVDEGREEARAGTSAIADSDLKTLMERFDGMLDSLGEARSRQQAAASRLVDSEERLRMRIAGQLYGDVGQRLAAILLVIGGAVRSNGSSPESDSDSALISALTDVQSEVADVLEVIRGTARSLRPPELDDLGLMAAVQAEVRTIDARSPVPVVLRAAPADLPLEEHEGLVLFRLIQESLAVVLEESAPPGIDLTIRSDGDSVRCDIETIRPDTGTTARIRGGLSDSVLEPVRERAAWIGGTVSVVENPPECPRVRIEVPAPRNAPHELGPAFGATEESSSSFSPAIPSRRVRPA